jgi:hypothetical protein
VLDLGSLDMVESARQLEHPPWIGDNMENVNTQMTATARIKAEMEQTIEEEGLEEYVKVYTDGSLLEDRVECAIICEAREIKIRLSKQMSICSSHSGSNKSHKKMGDCQKNYLDLLTQ